MKQKQLTIRELKLRRKNILNKFFLGIFLIIAISTLILKLIDGILLDLGWHFNGVPGIHKGFWMHGENYASANPGDPLFEDNPLKQTNKSMLSHHPSTLWLLTQFTWIITIVIIIFLLFSFFRYNEELPRWLRWIMTQRTLSLIVMYDMIVSIVFWIGLFNSFNAAFNSSLRSLELAITVLVHAIIPIFMLFYSLVYLIKDKKASILKEMFIIKGMIYPMIYIMSYILISVIWADPYQITHIHENITNQKAWASQTWIAALAMLGIWMLLGIMILFHNLILIKFNKQYTPEKDYDIGKRKQFKIEKIQRAVIRKHMHKNLYTRKK